MNIEIKNIIEYLFFIGPFLLIGISLFAIFIWLALRSQKLIKIVLLLIVLISMMCLSYQSGRTAERNNNQFKYIRNMEIIFSHFSFLLSDANYAELALKINKLRDEFSFSIVSSDRLDILVKYLTTPLDNQGLKDDDFVEEDNLTPDS